MRRLQVSAGSATAWARVCVCVCAGQTHGDRHPAAAVRRCFPARSLRDQGSVRPRPSHVGDTHGASASGLVRVRAGSEGRAAVRAPTDAARPPALQERPGQDAESMWRVYVQSDAQKQRVRRAKGRGFLCGQGRHEHSGARFSQHYGRTRRPRREDRPGILETQLPPFKITSP